MFRPVRYPRKLLWFLGHTVFLNLQVRAMTKNNQLISALQQYKHISSHKDHLLSLNTKTAQYTDTVCFFIYLIKHTHKVLFAT